MSDSCGELLEESAVDLTAAAALTADWLPRAADSRSTQRDISSISERESRVCKVILFTGRKKFYVSVIPG